MTFAQCIEKYIKENFIGTDRTCNGKCTKCGECCGIVLPLDEEDAIMIQDYVVKNRIFPQRYLRIVTNKIQCPYYTGNKEKGCSIYEARPKICRNFKCNKKMADYDEVRKLSNAVPVDMWSFAEAIEKEMIKCGLNKKNGKTINKSV